MAFDIMRLFEDESFVSPGSIGGKIKRFRELRGWSQKELGIRCGFSESTADVRIAQYEKNKKIPREKALKDIANALEVDETALFDADMISYNRMYHALFDLEDFHGLHPVKKPDGYYLEFSGPTVLDPQGITKNDFEGFLKDWYEMRQKYMPNAQDSSEDKETKRREYALWRGEYPHYVAKETTEKMRNVMRMNQLQAEMDALNAKMKNDEELSKIDKALKPFLTKAKKTNKPLTMESELIYLIKDLMEKGVGVECFSPEETAESDQGLQHLLSIRTGEILKDDAKKVLIAGLECAIESIRKSGINITRRITSLNKELFLTYEYPSSQDEYFDNLWKSWDDINYIIERKGHWSESEISELEKKFRKKITGKYDVSFAN